jgi:hypothetical protein
MKEYRKTHQDVDAATAMRAVLAEDEASGGSLRKEYLSERSRADK